MKADLFEHRYLHCVHLLFPLVSSIMEKVSSITGLKVVNRSVVHKGKVFTTLDDIVSEVTEHEDRYQGGIVIIMSLG